MSLAGAATFDARLWVARLVEINGVVQLMAMRDRKKWAGRFDNPIALLRAARQHDGADIALYTSLHRVNDEVNADNTMCRAVSGGCFGDGEFVAYSTLFFDCDPVRQEGNASDGELDAAERRGLAIADWLCGIGWPEPVLALSGNGHHAHFRINLSATFENRALLRRIYDAMARRFSDDEVCFDSAVSNPARLCRLYGFANRKGPHTPERPQRVAGVLMPVQGWHPVTEDQLHTLASELGVLEAPKSIAFPPAKAVVAAGKGDFCTLDVVSWMRAQGLYRAPLRSGWHAIKCPWVQEHTAGGKFDSFTGTAVAEAGVKSSWPKFVCQHAHCRSRQITDLMTLYGDADRYCEKLFAPNPAKRTRNR
jgi:hypothetical protein